MFRFCYFTASFLSHIHFLLQVFNVSVIFIQERKEAKEECYKDEEFIPLYKILLKGMFTKNISHFIHNCVFSVTPNLDGLILNSIPHLNIDSKILAFN